MSVTAERLANLHPETPAESPSPAMPNKPARQKPRRRGKGPRRAAKDRRRAGVSLPALTANARELADLLARAADLVAEMRSNLQSYCIALDAVGAAIEHDLRARSERFVDSVAGFAAAATQGAAAFEASGEMLDGFDRVGRNGAG